MTAPPSHYTPLHLEAITRGARHELDAMPLPTNEGVPARRLTAAGAAFDHYFKLWGQLPAIWAALAELHHLVPDEATRMLDDLLRTVNGTAESHVSAWQVGDHRSATLRQLLYELTAKELDELHHRVRAGVLDYVILRLVAAETQADTPLAA